MKADNTKRASVCGYGEDCASGLRGSGARMLETHLSRSTDICPEFCGGQQRSCFPEHLRMSVRRAARPQVLYRQHQLQKRLHGHWHLCIHFSFADPFNVEFAMTLPFPYSAHYWFDSGDASLFLHVEQISRDADRADSCVPRQKPAANSRTDRPTPQCRRFKGTRGGLHCLLPGQRSTFALWSRSRADR